MTRTLSLLLLLATLPGCSNEPSASPATTPTGNVIFIHPDGSSVQGWQTYRALEVGPDGNTAWDLLPEIGIYRSHVRNSLAATSHGGGTIHGYGIKVGRDSYGLDEGQPILAASGFDGSVMMEAIEKGIRCGIINSGHLAEPGTGAMLARVEKRSDKTGIVTQFLHSGADIILGGGEIYFLPEGQVGRHGQAGVREDGRNLIREFEKAGYKVVYDLAELSALDDDTARILGLFAADNTYNDVNEEELASRNLTPYNPNQPTVAQMMTHALRFLTHRKNQFFLMIEEEGTDNLANANNAYGTFEAYRRADACIAEARRFLKQDPDTLLITAADTDASGMQMLAVEAMWGEFKMEGKNLPPVSETGAALDGFRGTGTEPFLSAPDRAGKRFRFGVIWPTRTDLAGSVLARAQGLNADKLGSNVDNTDIYKLIYLTLFGRQVE